MLRCQTVLPIASVGVAGGCQSSYGMYQQFWMTSTSTSRNRVVFFLKTCDTSSFIERRYSTRLQVQYIACKVRYSTVQGSSRHIMPWRRKGTDQINLV
jgi:hypothetical protein